jgi:tetratricopeptide (TPR) repeat protein
MLWRKKPYDRGRVMAAADKARARGRVKKAVALYREVLAADPADLAVHAKLAPLLGRTGRRAEALASFRLAADGQARSGFPDRAVSLHLQATSLFPDDLPTWEEIVRLLLARGRRPDAVAALLQGGRRLVRARHRTAAHLLRRALVLEPWHPEGTLLLARVHWRSGQPADALELLDGLSSLTRGHTLRRARRLAFRIRPTPGNLWRWLKAAVQAWRRPAPAQRVSRQPD